MKAVDWLPTLAEYAEVSLPNSTEIDGLSLQKVIDDNATSLHDIMHWATGSPDNPKGSWGNPKRSLEASGEFYRP